ncbi:MAG: rod shape-determining protein MreC [Minisyncoccia bacterium]
MSSANFSRGFFALAFVLLVLLFRITLPNVFWQTFAPAFRASTALSSGADTFFSAFGNTATLAGQNAQLKTENAALANENLTLLRQAKDIQGLSSSTPAGGGGIVAGIVARPPTSPYDTLVLSVGTNGGVRVGDEAFGNGGVPIGVVSSVLPNFSRMTLFSDPNIAVDGWVGTSSVPITIIGAGAGAMRATLPRSASANVGNTVFVSGPGMLPVGTVSAIDSDPSAPSVTLRIQPAVNFFSVSWVLLRSTGSAFAGTLSWATSTLP